MIELFFQVNSVTSNIHPSGCLELFLGLFFLSLGLWGFVSGNNGSNNDMAGSIICIIMGVFSLGVSIWHIRKGVW